MSPGNTRIPVAIPIITRSYLIGGHSVEKTTVLHPAPLIGSHHLGQIFTHQRFEYFPRAFGAIAHSAQCGSDSMGKPTDEVTDIVAQTLNEGLFTAVVGGTIQCAMDTSLSTTTDIMIFDTLSLSMIGMS